MKSVRASICIFTCCVSTSLFSQSSTIDHQELSDFYHNHYQKELEYQKYEKYLDELDREHNINQGQYDDFGRYGEYLEPFSGGVDTDWDDTYQRYQRYHFEYNIPFD